uniref:Microsomal glutathione S-transferase 1 n=1 Tax=Chromera velia CCMP2878 TaxID=1169474 RepID=A0A0G4F490_9ALVE|eukprot:Cvel_15125.t1-p1 / transcript=Cvel_15125.t1 / gene=Cvel_15125 / organism=Chromera_velia_CCMP2878 / gene_product=hypothetical protein / transcript_product=hypothetical protein / location=Cvel_scaffold1104:13678-14157(+) / protein_length=160 / sequence_SO=supercontig / SO=protein_coding / is_pseudo=false
MLTVQNALQTSVVCTFVLFLKLLFSNLYLGHTKNKAGTRVAEDTYQEQGGNLTADEHERRKEAQDRAQRVVSNDLENIPIGLLVAWGSFDAISYSVVAMGNELEAAIGAFIALLAVFTGCRVLHTAMYMSGIGLARSLVYLISILSLLGLVILSMYAAFK